MIAAILDNSERLLRTEIKGMPERSYTYTDYLDGDGIDHKLFKMKVTLTIKGSNAYLDFTGLANPKKRRRASIQRDLTLGYVSRRGAQTDYGYQPKSA